MRNALVAAIVVCTLLVLGGCIDDGVRSRPTSFSRTIVVSDVNFPSYRSRIKLDQTVQDTEGIVTVTFINDTDFCVHPYWILRLVIGAVDRYVDDVSPAAIPARSSGSLGTFSFRARVDLANIESAVNFWYLSC